MQFKDHCLKDSEFDAAVAFLDMGTKLVGNSFKLRYNWIGNHVMSSGMSAQLVGVRRAGRECQNFVDESRPLAGAFEAGRKGRRQNFTENGLQGLVYKGCLNRLKLR